MTLERGARLGPYEILSPLGAGGMGEVYRALDSRLKREVAVKVLPEALAKDPKALARFEREALAVAALSHPNILAIHDFDRHDGVAFAVMELLEGETLRHRLEKGPLPQNQVVDYVLQIARGLAAAHEKGMVHRDLKPENLFVTKDGHLKILDFGLAKMELLPLGENATSAPTETKQTEPGTVMGTVGYMSPEQVRGRNVDHRSDIFSFGVVLYEMLAGTNPFRRETGTDMMAAILRDEPPELSESGKSIPTALDHIVKHCLEKSRDNRFQSAKDIAFALSEASGSAVTSRPRSVGASASSKRNLFIALAVVAGALGITAVLLHQRRPSTAVRSLNTIAPPSIAVLPFTNLSADKDQEYFSDGLSEELMGLLTKVKELHVAGRTSSFAFKGKSEDLRTIGKRLNVATVLEGSVRRSGDQLRVSTQLVSAADGYQIWAETYDRKMTEVFAVQDEIAGAVVAALKVKLLPQDRPVTSGHRTSNPEAYNQYLRGKQFDNDYPANYRRALKAYQKAIELDPGYAAAYAGLSGAEFGAGDLATSPVEMEDWRKKALSAAEKAITLDPELADGYVARGNYRRMITWDWSGAKEDFERALSFDPGSSDAHLAYGSHLASLGRVSEAIAETRKATLLDPLSPMTWVNLGALLNASGKFAEARKAFIPALEFDPEFLPARFLLGIASLSEGNPKAALPEFERLGGSVYRGVGLAVAEHDLGRAKESQHELDDLIAKYGHNGAVQIAEVYAWRGERDKAFEWLDRAFIQHDSGLPALKIDPLVAKLRDDPRYTALLRKMNLPVGK